MKNGDAAAAKPKRTGQVTVLVPGLPGVGGDHARIAPNGEITGDAGDDQDKD
jgi:hypothetical protein